MEFKKGMRIYRGKTVATEEQRSHWIYGSLIDFDGESDIVYIVPPHPCASNFSKAELITATMKPVHRETVGMFSGKYDRFKVPIFEGDILKKSWIFPIGARDEKTCEVFGRVVFRDCGMRMESRYYGENCFAHIDPMKGEEVVILGNIYNNPKLLEEVE